MTETQIFITGVLVIVAFFRGWEEYLKYKEKVSMSNHPSRVVTVYDNSKSPDITKAKKIEVKK